MLAELRALVERGNDLAARLYDESVQKNSSGLAVLGGVVSSHISSLASLETELAYMIAATSDQEH